jgi:hypothetical protein
VEEEEPLQGKFQTIQMLEEFEEPLQAKFFPLERVEEVEPLQGKFGTVQKKESSRSQIIPGCPINLKSGIEASFRE